MTDYDVIIVGARVAGSATAMLLSRAGMKVLMVDRASFPSDTLSTHQVQVPGVERLRRWGLLDALAGTPPARRVRFAPGDFVLEGRFPDGGAVYSPRRRLLDTVLVDAARAAGAEVREGWPVDELMFADGLVTGIRRGRQTERAPLVVGADGRHSMVARAVGADAYRTVPARSVGYYTYWAGVELGGGEIYGRGDRMLGAWPTNDGLVVTYVVAPVAQFKTFRADIEGNVVEALDRTDLGERIRAGERADRFYGTADTGGRFHRPFGPGWALVGDAGLVLDPITGQGISDALRDADVLAETLLAGEPLARYEQRRNDATGAMYDFTAELARFAPPKPQERALFSALAGRQREIDRFLGVLTGSVPMAEYFSPHNLRAVIGLRGMAGIAFSRLRPSGRMAA
jgi:flavin-dependent dehydrogenase